MLMLLQTALLPWVWFHGQGDLKETAMTTHSQPEVSSGSDREQTNSCGFLIE
jgi:hypothetical protein